nr:tyrosine-type recombinase/integrase [Anaerosolibacter carboniphilus]
MTIGNAIAQFLVDQELKGNTPKTIYNYERFLDYFAEFFGKDRMVDELTLMDLKRYQLSIADKDKHYNFVTTRKKKISKTTVQTYIRSLRVFINWLYNEGYITENLGAKFKLPKAPKKVVEVLSDEEIETLLGAINPRTEFGVRNHCIIALMLDSGLRRNEVLELDFDNVHFTQNVIKVSGKGQKERIVPLGLHTKKMLMKYMNGYRPMPEYETKRLFIDQEKKPLTDDAIKMFFQRLAKKTGIERLHPHMLRHTFATKYLINGGDIFSLQQILGHTSLEMVRRYSHLASSYVIHNFRRMSPLDNIQKRNLGF